MQTSLIYCLWRQSQLYVWSEHIGDMLLESGMLPNMFFYDQM
jgi:hypothetical protein